MSADKLQRQLQALDAALTANDWYGALQHYRTLVKRKLDGGHADDAWSLVAQGAKALAARAHPAEAADLVDMLVKDLEASHVPLTAAAVERVLAAAAAFPAGDGAACAAASPVLRAATRWAAHAPLREGGGTVGDEESEADWGARKTLAARLHLAAARVCRGAGAQFAADAQRHFLEAAAPEEFAEFLVAWIREGAYAGEADLFLARAVLQLLAVGSLGAANKVREGFLARVEAGEAGAGVKDAVNASPLVRFLRFLLLTAEVRFFEGGGGGLRPPASHPSPRPSLPRPPPPPNSQRMKASEATIATLKNRIQVLEREPRK